MADDDRFSIPPDHPSLSGHFPGNPIVPGVVLLDEVLVRLPRGAVLLTAKFLAPVRPGEQVAMAVDGGAPGRLAFACTVGGKTVLHGTARSG